MRKWITLLTLSVFCSVFYSMTPIQAQEPSTCPGFIESRLVVGQSGRVTSGQNNIVREEPSSQAVSIGSIPSEGIFEVLQGPVCAENFAWWHIYYDGLNGWTVEGADGVYWLEPSQERCSSPFQAGDEVEVKEYNSLSLYSEPDVYDVVLVLAELPEKSLALVMDAPYCGQRDNAVWIKVEYKGEIGWIEESRVIYCDSCGNASRVYFVRRPLLPLTPLLVEETAPRILALPTPEIDPERAITAANAEQLTLLNSIGEGRIKDFAWSPLAEGMHLAIANSVNVEIYDVQDLNADPMVLSEFAGTPETLLYNANGLLAVSDSGGVITLWDTQSYSLLSSVVMDVHFWSAGLAFNAAGTLLAAATSAGGVHVWDMTHPAQPDLIYTDSHAASNMRFVADTDQLVSQGESDFYLHTPTDGQSSRKFAGVEREIRGWTLSPDGERLIALTEEVNGDMSVVYATYITQWELTGNLPMLYADSVSSFEPQPYAAYDLEFRSDGRMLLYNLGDIHILEGIPSGEPGLNIPQTTDADYAPDDSFIAFGTNGGAVYLVSDREIVDTLSGIEGTVYEVEFSPDSRYLAARGGDNSVRLWDVAARELLSTVQPESLPISEFVVSHGGNTVLMKDRLYDAMTGQILEMFETAEQNWHSPVIARSSGQFVGMRVIETDDARRSTIVTDLKTGEVVGEFQPVNSFAVYDAEGRFVAISPLDKLDQPYVEVIETHTGGTVRLIERYFEEADSSALNATGELLVVEDFGLKQLLLWDVRDGALLATIPIDQGVFRVVFSPDSRKIAWVYSTSGGLVTPAVYVYDILEGKTIQTSALPESTSGIYHLTFNVDGSLIAVGYDDGNMYLIDANSGLPGYVFPARQDGSDKPVFSADGTRLFGFGEDNVLRVWGLDSE